MFLDSIAAGIMLAGIILTVVVFADFLWHGDKGSPWDTYKAKYGVDWGTVSLTILTLLALIGGSITTLSLGFTFGSVHYESLIGAGLATFALVSVVNILAGRHNRKAPRKTPATKPRARSTR